MLDGAVKRGDAAEVEILPLLRTGVDESYQDVRELLTISAASCRRAIYTWRSRTPWTASAARPAWIPSWQWASARARRWRRTSSCRCCSSCRRRCRTCASEAARVRVEVEDGRDFVLDISDDGQGYDAEEVAARGEAHVGLHIMRERAARMRAVIKLESRPGQGTRVLLTLPGAERQAAEGRSAARFPPGRPLQGRRRGPAKPAPRDPAELSHGPRDRVGGASITERCNNMSIRILLVDDHTLFRSGGCCCSASPISRSWPRPATASRA